jgi:maltokinase
VSGMGDPQIGEQVLRYISGARWFAGKGRQVRLRSLTPLPWLTEVSDFFRPAAPPAVRFEIAEVTYPASEDPDPTAPVAAESDEDTHDSALAGAPEMDSQIQAWPTEYYQLAVSYRPAPQADLHHAEIGRFDDPDLGPVIAYDAPQDPQACGVILSALLAGRRLRSPDREVRITTTPVSYTHIPSHETRGKLVLRHIL